MNTTTTETQTVKIWDLPNLLTQHKMNHDGDKTDLRLHAEDQFNWGAKLKKDYVKAEKEINKIEYKGNGYTVYAWCDISGHHYWMKNMHEMNYIQITVAFDNDSIDTDEVENLAKHIDAAISEAALLESRYDYYPENED